MLQINATFPIGFMSDAHGNVGNLDLIRAKHPEIKQWFFLGDLVCFINPQNNKKAGEWLDKNKDSMVFIKGNHDHVVAKQFLHINYDHAWLLAQFERNVRIDLSNDKNLFLCHSKPKDFWEFINVGYTEREFEDDFAGYIDENTVMCIGGHTHKPLKHTFPNCDTSLFSLGAACHGEYAIMTGKGIEFKKL